MIAGTYNIICEQGTTFTRILDIERPDPDDSTQYIPYNLTGHTARMQVRRTIESTTPMLTLTTENGGISISGTIGRITINASATQTAALTSSGVYDIEIISSSGAVSRVVQGNFNLSLEVTR